MKKSNFKETGLTGADIQKLLHKKSAEWLAKQTRKSEGKPIQVPMYLSPGLKEGLDSLSEVTRIQRSVLVREAISDLIDKYMNHLLVELGMGGEKKRVKARRGKK